MGGDGGSIPGRADIVRTKGMKFLRNLGGMGYNPNTMIREGSTTYSTTEHRRLRCTTCALTQEPFSQPVVACRMGKIYNKDAAVRALLDKNIPEWMSHVRSLKDIKTLKVALNEATGALTCGITKQDLDAHVKGVVIWTCGCVVSRKVLANIGKADICPVCGSSFSSDKDVVYLVPDEEETKVLEKNLAALGETDKRRRRSKPCPRKEESETLENTPNSKKQKTEETESSKQ